MVSPFTHPEYSSGNLSDIDRETLDFIYEIEGIEGMHDFAGSHAVPYALCDACDMHTPHINGECCCCERHTNRLYM